MEIARVGRGMRQAAVWKPHLGQVRTGITISILSEAVGAAHALYSTFWRCAPVHFSSIFRDARSVLKPSGYPRTRGCYARGCISSHL